MGAAANIASAALLGTTDFHEHRSAWVARTRNSRSTGTGAPAVPSAEQPGRRPQRNPAQANAASGPRDLSKLGGAQSTQGRRGNSAKYQQLVSEIWS